MSSGSSLLSNWNAMMDCDPDGLVRLLIERAKVAAVIGRAKRASGFSIHAPEREDAVLRNVAKLACAPFGPRELERVFRTVIEETRRAEESSE